MRRFFGIVCAVLISAEASAEEVRFWDEGVRTPSPVSQKRGATFLLFPPMPDLPNPFSPGFGRGASAKSGSGSALFDVRLAAHEAVRLPEVGLDLPLGNQVVLMSGVDRVTVMLRAGGDMEAGERLSRWRASAGAAAAEGPVSVGVGLALASETETKPVELYGGVSVRLNF